MEFESNEVMLLTGAGFSANFGCPLAQEMWSWIFNNPLIQNSPTLRELMLKYPNFESVIYQVRNHTESAQDKDSMEEALRAAYQVIDEKIIDWRRIGRSGSNSLNMRDWQQFLTMFSGKPQTTDKGFIFTLNQDLLLEREYVDFQIPGSVIRKPNILGLNNQQWFSGSTITDSFGCNIPEQKILDATIEDQMKYSNFFTSNFMAHRTGLTMVSRKWS